MKVQKFSPVQQLDVFVRARYPIIWIVSAEESRVEASVRGLFATHPKHSHKQVFTWTISKGVRFADQPDEEYGPEDPIAALQFVGGYGREQGPRGLPSVFLFKDLSPYFQDPRVVRALRDVVADIGSTQKTLIVIDTQLSVPQELKRQVAVIDWPLPVIEELSEMLDDFIADLESHDPPVPVHLNGDREQVARALMGLTWFQAQSVLATAVIATGRLDSEAVQFIISEKARLVKESGLLEFFQPEGLPDIGGLDLLVSYLSKRRRAFTDEARKYGAPTPKGLLMVGVPGCGKSLACKTLAKLWNLPLIRLDVGSLMGSLVGQSEANLRQALAVAESAAPAILWLDELEKGLSGVQSSGMSDGGTTARVFGNLLTWMQERTAPVYVVATSNDITAMPPELLRAGRFDDIFFVDLPNADERAEIWNIHIGKVGRKTGSFDLDALIEASASYTGAEIEQAVADSLFFGFDEGREITTDDLVDAVKARVPLTETMREKITGLREWAAHRAKPASSVKVVSKASQSRAAGLDL